MQTIIQALRDPLWTFVTVAVGIITLIVIVIQRHRKALSYEVLSRTPLLTREEEVAGKLQVLYDGEPVRGGALDRSRNRHTGNVPILPGEYVHPVALYFGRDAQVLSAEVLGTEPRDLEALLHMDGPRITLTPCLLNGGDVLVLKTMAG